jgi:hypothetical protein
LSRTGRIRFMENDKSCSSDLLPCETKEFMFNSVILISLKIN